MRKTPWPEVFAVAIVAGATAVAIKGWPGGVESQTLAAWVQAVGSILAIVGTVWAVNASAKKSARLQEKRQHTAVLAVVNAVAHRVDLITDAINSEADWRSELANCYVPTILDRLSEALREIPAHELPSPEAVTSFLMLQQHMGFFSVHVAKLDAGPWADAERVKVLNMYLGEARREREKTFCEDTVAIHKWLVLLQVHLIHEHSEKLRQCLSGPN